MAANVLKLFTDAQVFVVALVGLVLRVDADLLEQEGTFDREFYGIVMLGLLVVTLVPALATVFHRSPVEKALATLQDIAASLPESLSHAGQADSPHAEVEESLEVEMGADALTCTSAIQNDAATAEATIDIGGTSEAGQHAPVPSLAGDKAAVKAAAEMRLTKLEAQHVRRNGVDEEAAMQDAQLPASVQPWLTSAEHNSIDIVSVASEDFEGSKD